MQNQPGSDLVLADCVRFLARRIQFGSKPMCKNHPARFWPMPPSRSGPDPACLLGSDELQSVLNEANPESKSVACRSSNNLPLVAVYHLTGVSRMAVQLAVCLESAVKTWPVSVVCLEVSILNTGQSQCRVS